MKIILCIKYLLFAFIIMFSNAKTTGQTYYKLYDCTVSYSKTDSTNNDNVSSRIKTIKHITDIGLKDTVSIILNTNKGKSNLINLKDIKNLTVYSKNIAGKSAGYGAIIGFGILGSFGFFLGLSESSGSAAIYGLVSGGVGSVIGVLIGLMIGTAGNEPDVLDLSIPLTNTDKRNRIVKFLDRLNNQN